MKAKVNNILMTAKGNKYDVYYTLCDEYITENDEPYVVLKQILEFSDKIGVDDDSEPSNISLTEIKGIEEKYTSLIVEISEVLAEENLEEDEYYKKLYDAIFLSNFLPRTKKTQATFLKILCENVRVVPYYQATNLVKLSNDEFATTFEKLKPHIIKAMHKSQLWYNDGSHFANISDWEKHNRWTRKNRFFVICVWFSDQKKE